ncbi:MAG: hypothetical protein ACLQU2_03195 [Candidatus Binataceae bacterium]
MTDYEKGLEKLGFIYDDRLDLRRHPAFAWRVLCVLPTATFENWMYDVIDNAQHHEDALYAAVEELGKGECNGQK